MSLSLLIENYLLKMVSDLKTTIDSKGSIVDELSGIITLNEEDAYKEEYIECLAEKYK